MLSKYFLLVSSLRATCLTLLQTSSRAFPASHRISWLLLHLSKTFRKEPISLNKNNANTSWTRFWQRPQFIYSSVVFTHALILFGSFTKSFIHCDFIIHLTHSSKWSFVMINFLIILLFSLLFGKFWKCIYDF